MQVLAEKIYRISDNIACTVAGITADANILINRLRYVAAEYKYGFGEPIPVEQLVQSLCNEKQRYTQIGGAWGPSRFTNGLIFSKSLNHLQESDLSA